MPKSGSGSKPNAWNEFRSAHAGQGYTMAELSAMYKGKSAKKPAKKPVAMVKQTTTKGKGTGDRLSAGAYYAKYGDAAVGHVCDIRGDGELKCLLLDKNGRPRWSKPSKSGAGQESCGSVPWSARCSESVRQQGGFWW